MEKNKIILAKILTGISFAFGMTVVMELISFWEFGILYGFEGADLPAQLLLPFVVQKLTIAELSVIAAGSGIAASMFTSVITLAVSAKIRGSSSVLIIMFLFLFVPLFFSVPSQYKVIAVIFSMLPSLISSCYKEFSCFVLRLGDHFFFQYQYVYAVYLILGTAFAVLAYYSYKHRQVGK